MPFSIDKNNYSIKTRCGDSVSVVFKFNLPIDGFFVDFCISEEYDNYKVKPVIQKCYRNITGNLLEVKLLADETEKLKCEGSFSGKYFWGLKIHNDNGFAATLIPDKFNRRPRFIVYPKIGECIYE